MSVYGDHLGPLTACFGFTNSQETEKRILPNRLCETEVRVGGIPAGLLYVQARQINFKVPQEVPVQGTTTVQVIHKGWPGPAVTEPFSVGEQKSDIEKPKSKAQ